MPISEILRRAAQLVAAGWSPGEKALDAAGEPALIYGGTVGDTARAGVNAAITHHTLYSAVVAAAHEEPGVVLAPAWDALFAATSGYGRGGTGYVHPVVGFNMAEGRTAEEVQALLHQVADDLDPNKPKAATPLPPVTF